MEPHFRSHSHDPLRPLFPSLPVVTPEPSERRSQQAKYGGLFYFGIAGLVALVTLVAWFGYGVWSMRDIWSNIYVLHDAQRTEQDRIQAAWTLSRDSRVTQDQYWEMALRKPLPSLARYLLAEALTGELAARDPSQYANAVAKSPDWPDWLRIVLVRPLAYASIEGSTFPREPIGILKESKDPAIQLWTALVLATERKPDLSALQDLEKACEGAGSYQELACLLRDVAKSNGPLATRKKQLDLATEWLRAHHPAISPLWKGWTPKQEKLVPGSP